MMKPRTCRRRRRIDPERRMCLTQILPMEAFLNLRLHVLRQRNSPAWFRPRPAGHDLFRFLFRSSNRQRKAS